MVSALPGNKAIEEVRPVGTKLTPEKLSRIQRLIEAGMYISISDFVREAITDKLRDIKVIKVRDVNYDVATREVLDYYTSSLGNFLTFGTKFNKLLPNSL